MAFYGDNNNVDQRYWTPFNSNYDYDFDPAPSQASTEYFSPHESGEPQLPEFKSSSYSGDDSFVTPPGLNYSIYTDYEPPKLQYQPIDYHSSHNYYEYSVFPSEVKYYNEPPPYCGGYSPSETKFTISYSKVEFNEPEFEDYDPTPYDGGYDIVTTYGKPLPPSEGTCYPRSVPQSDTMPMENFSFASIPSPYGKDADIPTKPLINGSKPVDMEKGDKVISDSANVEPSDVIPGNGDSPCDGNRNGFENATRGDYGDESERQVHQMPYGSGLEAMDLCESIFGHWPCLAKMEQRQRKLRQVYDQQRRMDPWKSAADYLFGSPLVYDYENYHHQQQQQQAQYEYYENSWWQ